MKKTFFTKQNNLILILLVDVVAIISIIFLMNHVQVLLKSDVEINLTEIVTQNKDVITSKLAMELNDMELEAKQLSEKIVAANSTDVAVLDRVFLEYVAHKENSNLVYATPDGHALSSTGKAFDISGRTYFRHGISGTPNISERIVSRENGDDVFVLCVPLFNGSEILGTIQKQYTPSEMYSLCSVSLFSEQGSTYIINSEGYVLISSENSEYNRESVNYYRIMYLTDPTTSKRLEADIKANRAGFMDAVIDGKKTFFAYTPIDQIYDWYLISSLPTSTVSPNANIVVKIFYCILFATAAMFTISLIYYSKLKRKQQKDLENVAFVDNITGGDSFTKFSLDVENAIYSQANWPLYICSFDIDNFKYINSFYSFEAGNIILQELYENYKARLKPSEFISRMTADKFVMLLTDVSEERMKELIKLEFVVDGIKIYISAGLYQIPEFPQSVGLMVDKAFMASQKVKGQHFKHVELYSDELDEQNAHNEQIKRNLESALEKGEIIPFFQPKVNIHTGELVGAEALARWLTSDGQLIPPGEFIPICEKTGLISLVDMAIFEQTLKFIQHNLNNNVSCAPISVNFSRLHLLNEDFVETILSKISQYSVPPELIELELTETVIFENFQTITNFIKTIHSHGLRISMDDFGSGYSSLHMLKDTEIDVLKIDRGFLLDTASSSRQRTIFGAIVHMAKQLQIEVIVEGVETDENVELLKEFGCNNAQGFYYARPMDYDSFERVYREGKI